MSSQQTFHKIVQSLKSGTTKNVVVLSGAGISTASGIPDFRSAGGLYDTLDPSKLTASEREKQWMMSDPTAVVNFELFKHNPFPYLEVRRSFILGTHERKWRPTFGHFFIKLLHDKQRLKRVYTQNIDGLHLQVEVPTDKIIQVHGSLALISCEFCGEPYPADQFYNNLKTSIKNIYDTSDSTAPESSSYILCLNCNRPGVKPSTTMYGRSLPPYVAKALNEDFPRASRSNTRVPTSQIEDVSESEVDLMIVVGTSLTVHPAAGYVQLVSPYVPRLVINREPVGEELGLEYGALEKSTATENIKMPRDCLLQGDSDSGFIFLAKEVGWLHDMLPYREFMCERSQLYFDQALAQS